MLKKHLQLRVSSAAVGPAPAFPVRPRSQTRRDLFPPSPAAKGFSPKRKEIAANLSVPSSKPSEKFGRGGKQWG